MDESEEFVELSADEILLRDIDRDSATWRAVVAWAKAKRAQCAENLLHNSNTHEDSVFIRGKANGYLALVQLGDAASQLEKAKA